MEQILTIIQNTLLEETAAIPVSKLIIAVLVACVAGILVAVIYRVTYTGVVFEKQFMLGLILMSMITSIIILAISSNLVLSLGMVGALSIVRFRTAVKEPMDTIFMFWALAAGILVGAGFFVISILAILIVGTLFILVTRFGKFIKSNNSYLLVIRYEAVAEKGIRDKLSIFPRWQIKTKRTTEKNCELVLELSLSASQIRQLDQIRFLPGVTELNLVSNHSDLSL